MTKYLSLIVVAVIIGGCTGRTDELERQNAELRNKSSELSADISSRDAYIDTVTQSINEIYANLEGVRAGEKMIASETSGLETGKHATNREVRQRILTQLSTINESMAANRKKLTDVQAKMASYRTQFSGLRKMVATLKKTIEDREQSIAALETKVHGLESDVAEKTRVVTEKEAVITAQTTKINTAYYVVGKRSDLEQKGIIAKDGGFLWGLLGSSTILASGVDPKYFTPINKVEERTIQVNGKIDEVIPKRSPEFYTKTLVDNNQSMITIAEPTAFWQDQYLVIITD